VPPVKGGEMYKVDCELLAIIKGEIGNISQGKKVVYLDCEISEINKNIQAYFEPIEKYAIIRKVEMIDGILLK